MLWWFIVVWIASGAVIPLLWLLGLLSRGVSARSATQGPAIIRHAAPAMSATAQPAHGVRMAAATMLAWLFSLTEHRPGGVTTARPRVVGLYLLSGLVGIGVLVLLLVAPLNDSGHARHDLASSPGAAAQVPVARAAIAEAHLMQSPASSALSAGPVESAVKPGAGETGCDAPAVKSSFLGESPLIGGTEPAAASLPVQDDAAVSARGTASRLVDDDAAPPAQVPVAVLTPPVYHAPAGMGRGSVPHRARAVVLRPYATGASRGTWLSVPNQNGGSNS